jgi:hypothetical protein
LWQAQKLMTETQSRSATGRGTKRPSTLNDIVFYLQAESQKKIEHELIYFFLQLLTLILQFSNFKVTVVPTSKIYPTTTKKLSKRN